MKKIIATMLCLSLATPCFAAGRYPMPPHQQIPPRAAYHHVQPPMVYHEPPVVHHRPPHYTSNRTRTFAAIAGVGIAAAFISAIID